MLDLITVALFIIIFVLTYLYWQGRTPASLPPGPVGWPFIGNLGVISNQTRKLHVETDQWGKQYGGLFNLQLAQIPTIFITDLSILKEALIEKADIWSDRPLNNHFLQMVTKGVGGVTLQNGETWKAMRRMTVHSLKDFGVGKKSIEERINEELDEVVKEIGEKDGQFFYFGNSFNKAVLNVVCSVLFSNRYPYDDQRYQELIFGLNALFKGGGFQNPFIFLPWYTFWMIPILTPNIRQLIKYDKNMYSFFEREIQEHRATYDKNNLRDFVDMYLEAEEKGDSTHHVSEKRILQVIGDLFIAGGETTSTTLLWAFRFLIEHKHIQDKCRQEIKEKIGFDRAPTYADRTSLPYIEATINEVLRLGNTVPIMPFHNTARTETLHGYVIPKNTMMMANFYSIHMDPKHWDEPKQFRPERFLDDDGNFKRPDAFVGFGMGRRNCLGENLARMELFLFLTGLLQKFEFEAEDVSKLPSVEDTTLGVTLIPDHYSLRAVRIN